jgi:formate dehydrogenase maturation protein FdhE
MKCPNCSSANCTALIMDEHEGDKYLLCDDCSRISLNPNAKKTAEIEAKRVSLTQKVKGFNK